MLFQLEIHDKDRVFHALSNTGNTLMSKMANEEKTMLEQKLSEMSSRWKALQNKMLDINLILQKQEQAAKDKEAEEDDNNVPDDNDATDDNDVPDDNLEADDNDDVRFMESV